MKFYSFKNFTKALLFLFSILVIMPAIKNALLAKTYFPEWICRYYHDNTVPEIIIEKLKSLDNTELIFIEKLNKPCSCNRRGYLVWGNYRL